jgi:hypothetical protein
MLNRSRKAVSKKRQVEKVVTIENQVCKNLIRRELKSLKPDIEEVNQQIVL